MGVPLDGGEKWRAEEEKREALKSLNEAVEKSDAASTKAQDGTAGELENDLTEASTEEPTNMLSREASADQLHDSLDLDAVARSQENGPLERQLDNWLRFHGLIREELNS
ncbi:hypothetical protein McanMca71_002028 [Microsporum canis]|uniref:Uncharacterized protein n=1 Tax=Arthroderma otae (strain ATCC MYA-4605 / CBS 113480) TaxID=554155 RepID=C5FZ10_ARTOC|nr:uncharacterized protein MCYG_07577 [Microsporum canis CBS 113480]EEQ34758.1 predicted protein [Microsporum canis CBS 113480]